MKDEEEELRKILVTKRRTDNFSTWSPKRAKNTLSFSLLCILILSIYVEYAEYFVSHKCLQSASVYLGYTTGGEKYVVNSVV